MQRIAELEAQVTALESERDAPKRQSTRIDVDALGDAIGNRLMRVEQNLREDFVGKFAGNFLLATETITNRVVALEKRGMQLEKRHKELEMSFENHISTVKEKLAESGVKQLEFIDHLDNFIEHFREEHKNAVSTHMAILQGSLDITKAMGQAVRLCMKFADDYEQVSITAKERFNTFADEMAHCLRNHMKSIEGDTRNVANRFIHCVELTEEQLKRKFLLVVLSVFLGLAFSSGFAWLTQPQRSVERDAQNWRTFTGDLSPTQRERARKLIEEIRAEPEPLQDKLR